MFKFILLRLFYIHYLQLLTYFNSQDLLFLAKSLVLSKTDNSVRIDLGIETFATAE